MDVVINIALWAVFGLLAGAVAKFIMPGRDPGGIVATILLGIAGAVLGGFIGNALGWTGAPGPDGRSLFDWRTLVPAIGGALLLLLAYRALRMLSGTPAYGEGAYGAPSRLAAYGTTPAALSTPNLADVAKTAVTPEVINKLSSVTGESPTGTRKALEAMIPTILAGAASQAATSTGAARLYDMVKESVAGGTDVVGNLASHLTGSGIESMGRTSQGFLTSIFGDKLSGLLSWFSRFAGIKSSAVSSLMSVASSLVMSVLGKQVLQKGLNASGLGSLLSAQSSWLSRLLPSGVSEVPGLSTLADYAGQAGAAVGSAAEYGERAVRGTVDAGERAVRGAYRGAASAVHDAKPWANALAPLLLMGLALGAMPFIMRGCATKDTPIARAPDVRVADVRVPDANVTVPVTRVSGYTPDPGRLVKIKLPDGSDLEIPEASFVKEVHKYLADTADTTKSRAFVFENLSFDGTTIKSVPETESVAKAIGTLLKAFPSVTIRIDGHTDRVGDPVLNKRHSLDRANAVKAVFVRLGIPADKISTEGFGSERPIAPNDTEDNRAKNRRIELALVKK